jgi:hypothetical protein
MPALAETIPESKPITPSYEGEGMVWAHDANKENSPQLAELGTPKRLEAAKRYEDDIDVMKKEFALAEAGPDNKIEGVGVTESEPAVLNLDVVKEDKPELSIINDAPVSEVKNKEALASETEKEIPVQEAPANIVEIKVGETTAQVASEEVVPAKPEAAAEVEQVNTKTEAALEVQTEPEVKEVAPENETEMKKLEDFYNEIGIVAVEGWRKYINIFPNKNNDANNLNSELTNILRKTAHEIFDISNKFNEGRKTEEKETVDSHLPVGTSLKEIYIQNFINRATNNLSPQNLESLEGVMRDQLGQLLNIGEENRIALEIYISGIFEMFDNEFQTERGNAG